MPLKDIKEPKGSEKKERKPKSTDTPPESPWRIEDDGTKTRQGRKLPYEAQIQQLIIELSGLVALTDSFSANILELRSEELAYGYARLAKDDPRVRAFFDKLLTGSSWSAALVPTVTVAIAIAFHYGIVPAKIGVPVTLMAGAIPVTREQEQYAQQEARKQQEAAAAQDKATHPHGEAPQGDSDA